MSKSRRSDSKQTLTMAGMETDNVDITKYADVMLDVVRGIIKQEIEKLDLGTASSCQLRSAVVSRINEDGTVNVYFPPNKNSEFTHISNQSIYELQVGDNVELILKDGSFSNCWVCAKHKTPTTPNPLTSQRE